MSDSGLEATIRTFESGANRNPDNGKLDYEGYLSPVVLRRFAEYMYDHTFLEDGTRRESDNWQLGIPADSYMKSMFRHFMDAWLCHRGYLDLTDKEFEDVLCAIMFNAMGYLHEVLKD